MTKIKTQSKKSQVTFTVKDLLREQITGIVLFILVSILLFICYPYPYLTSDSGEYVTSAMRLANNPYRPIGYALFLSAFHIIVSSAQAVPLFQTLVYFFGVLYFLYALRVAIHLSAAVRRVLGIVLLLNPLALFYVHHFLSDSIFAAATLCFAGALIRYTKTQTILSLVEVVVWAGVSLMMRHVGLLYFIFTAGTFIILLREKSVKPLLMLSGGGLAIILLLCWKMEKDLGSFRLNTFDGWTLWAVSAKYIDLSPEYRNSLSSQELKEMYEYFAGFRPEVYVNATDLEIQWSPESPAKQLLYYYIQNYRMNYYSAYIQVNDKLKLVAKDIIMHRLGQYVAGSLLPSVAKGFWPDMMLNDTGWKNYPAYPVTPEPDQVIKAYYSESTSTWKADADIFPQGKVVIDFFIRSIAMLWAGALGAWVFVIRNRKAVSVTPLLLLLNGFMIFYIFSISALSIIYTRYLIPISLLQCVTIAVVMQSLFIKSEVDNTIAIE